MVQINEMKSATLWGNKGLKTNFSKANSGKDTITENVIITKARFVISSAIKGNLENLKISTTDNRTENKIAKTMQARLRLSVPKTNVLNKANRDNAKNAPKISFEKNTI